MRHLRKRLTYSNVMSSIAVFLVIGGATALAALPKNSVGTKQLKKNAVNSAKVKDNSLTGADINESTLGTVPSATNANHASSADNATNATNATNASSLGGVPASGYTRSDSPLLPRGYAFVEANGKVDPNFSSGIPNGTHPSPGVFCFDLAFTPKSAQVTVESDAEPNDMGSVSIAGVGEEAEINCPAGTDVEVETLDIELESLSSEQFFLVVW